VKCLTHPEESFDIAVLGCPFDTAVSYRPGRFSSARDNGRGKVWARGNSGCVRASITFSFIWTSDGDESVQ
jgi:hypothetical protein